MTKIITIRINEGGIVRTSEVTVRPGMTSADILARWKLNEDFLQNAVTRIVYPRRLDLFPIINDGDLMETIHDSLLVAE